MDLTSAQKHTQHQTAALKVKARMSVLPAEDVLSVFTESSAIQNEPANIKHLETVLYQHLRQMVDMNRMLITSHIFV